MAVSHFFLVNSPPPLIYILFSLLKPVEFWKTRFLMKNFNEKINWYKHCSLHISAKWKDSAHHFFVFQKIYQGGIILWLFGFSVMSANLILQEKTKFICDKHNLYISDRIQEEIFISTVLHEPNNRLDEWLTMTSNNYLKVSKINVLHMRGMLWGFGAKRHTPK